MNWQLKSSPHLAACLPEVVSHILSFLVPGCYYEEPNKKMYVDLHPCLFVNRLWHDCAIRILWRKAVFDDTEQDLDAFLKFASIINNPPTLSFQNQMVTISYEDSAMVIGEPSLMRYPSRSSSLSSVSTFDSVDTPSECSMMDYEEPTSEHMIRKDVELDGLCINIETGYHYASIQTRHNTHLNALRFLSVRKIKQKSINESLACIGERATKLTHLDMYICDYFSNDILQPFLMHGCLTYLSLAGCNQISDKAIVQVAEHCRDLEHLDLRACGLVSDVSISTIALNCRHLKHLNVGRVKDREKVTSESITLIAKYTQVTVLGLAGCDIDDRCMQVLAKYRSLGLERVSLNSCFKISNDTVYAFIKHCPNLSVFEMRECHGINNWEAVAELVQRKVLLTLCEHQNRACADWARVRGRIMNVRAPLK